MHKLLQHFVHMYGDVYANWREGTLETLSQGSMLARVNIVLNVVAHTREDRMALLEAMYGRPFNSSKELTFAEAKALLTFTEYQYVYHVGAVIDADVRSWMQSLLEAQSV